MTGEPQAVGGPDFDWYQTYPHHNGFLPDGQVVLGRLTPGKISLCRLDPDCGTCVELCHFPRENEEDYLWFDVAVESGRLVVAPRNELWIFDGYAAGPGSGTKIADLPHQPAGAALPAITAAGDRVVLESREDGGFGMLMVNVSSGESQTTLFKNWHANHFHFCPHDENWVAFSHEGPTEKISDRVWGWHAEKAPEGICLFDQTGSGLCVGHERWCFHHTAAIGVAYGQSPGGPRGLYEFFPDQRPPRLISEADRDWHVNISRDAKWAVVDTTGPHDRPGRGWENADKMSDIVLVELSTGNRTFLASSRIEAPHPFHPHPAFDPKGKWIYFNRPEASGPHRVLRIANPLYPGDVRK